MFLDGIKPPSLSVEVCEQKFPVIKTFVFTATIDIPPRIAWGRQWRYTGIRLYIIDSHSVGRLLGRGSMFVYSMEQFRRLLAVTEGWRGGALLDLGAGDGKTTEVMAPLFSNVYVTEISGPMRWILLKRGFQ
jgi:DREV methyltransferase.